MIISLAILLAIACLWPLAHYVFAWGKDPFNPLIFFGALTFFVADYGILTDYERTIRLVTENDVTLFLAITLLSVVGFYAGWFRRKRREGITDRVGPQRPLSAPKYRAHVLVNWAALYALFGVSIALYTREDYTVTGYLRDLGGLWVAAALLAIEALSLLPSTRPISLIIYGVCMIPPIDRFFAYGQRGDTFRVAVLVVPYFLMRGKRPARVFLIPMAIALALTLGTLERTRALVGTGEATGRIDALFKVIPSFFNKGDNLKTYGAREYIFGTAMIATVRDEQSYDCGKFIYNIGVRFLPKEGFDKLDMFTPWYVTNYIKRVTQHAVFEVPGGSAPTGFANAFVEFGWASPIFWMLIGYLARTLYTRATSGSDIAAIGYLTAFFIVLLYLVTQDLYAPAMNAIYTFPALFIAYKSARLPASDGISSSLERPGEALPT